MITRRNLMLTSTAAAAGGAFDPAPATAHRTGPLVPLREELRVRTLSAYRSPTSGRLILFTDGPVAPRKLIKPDVLNAVFGKGTDAVLAQPDHWRMIDAGWFDDADLYMPTGYDDPALQDWHAVHDPRVEAHDLLIDLFADRDLWFGGGTIPELNLTFMRHPQSPRFVTAHLTELSDLPRLRQYLAERTRWLTLDLVVHDGWPETE